MSNALLNWAVDEKIAVAAIAAIAAVLAALISARTARELERLKATMASRRAESEAHAGVLAAQLTALDAGATAIQAFKDEVQLVLSAARNGLSAADAITNLTKARVDVLASYSSHHPALESPDKDRFHLAKNLAIATHTLLSEALHGHAFASEIALSDRASALELRLQLTDAQLAMQNRRASLQTELLERRRA